MPVQSRLSTHTQATSIEEREKEMPSLRKTLLGGLASILLAGISTATAIAAPGDLDPRFSTDGKVLAGFKKQDVSGPVEIAMQADGKFVVLATVVKRERRDPSKGHARSPNQNLALARYTRKGKLDRSFSEDGKLVLSLPDREQSAGVALQPDGKLVAAATTRNDFLVVRLTKRGKLDRSFSDDGQMTADFGLEDDAEALAVQGDGGIVVAGSARQASSGSSGSITSDFAVARFTASGSLDSSFSADGLVTSNLPPATAMAKPGDDLAHDLALTPSGAIVVTGESRESSAYSTNSLFTLVRYLPDGNLDQSFGESGVVKSNFGSGQPLSLTLGLEGSIYSGGTADGSFALARYLADGSLDPSFGGTGEVEVDAGGDNDSATEVAVGADGRPLLAGSTDGSDGSGDFALLRFTSQGELDPSFSEDGRVTVDFGGGERAEGMVLQGDGKIVLAGLASNRIGITRHEVATGPADRDADGVEDADDRCSDRFGERANGCPRRGR